MDLLEVSMPVYYRLISYHSLYTGGDVDYGSGPYNVTFPAGTTTVQFDVTINGDKILERDEDFLLTINTSSLPNRVMVVEFNNQATVIIKDDDGMKITAKYEIIT